MEIEPTLLAQPNVDDADSLVSSNEPDDLANEQTWPTEEEMQGARDAAEDDVPEAKKGTTPKRVRRVPKGTSEYQAAWIIDDEDEEDGGDEEADEREEEMEDEEEEMVDFPVKDDDDMETDGRKSVAFQDLDAEEEDRQ